VSSALVSVLLVLVGYTKEDLVCQWYCTTLCQSVL